MGNTYRIVAVSGNTQQPSRTRALIDALLSGIGAALPVESQLIELGALAPSLAGVLARSQAPAEVEAQLRAIETADALIVASPVYRASYTGLFKHLFDLVHHEALIDVPVLLAATGGSERHALVIDHQLRPLFSFFQARTLPIGVYASEQDFRDYTIVNPALRARIELAIERAVPLVREATGSVSSDSSAAVLAA
jgi:FMN reductase